MDVSPLIFDVRPDLKQGQDPCNRIMQATDHFSVGQEFLLIAPFEPVPLYRLMEQQGFAHTAEHAAPNEWRVTFRRTSASALPQHLNSKGRVFMDAVTTLNVEHAAILQVLEQLEEAAAASERGVPVPVDIYQDIQEFFTVFVDHCHHGKEEAELFPRLQRDHAALIDRLEADHAAGRQLALAFAQAVQNYQPGEKTTGATLAAAARAYADFLRGHIDLETQGLFPAVESALEAQDQQLVAAFERIEVERIGAGTHERLHGMIDGLAGRIAPFLSAERR